MGISCCLWIILVVLFAPAAAHQNNNTTVDIKNAHGIINVVSWGIMMPAGAMMARYVKVLAPTNPVWFYLHVSCQCLAYALGVAGLVTGVHLGGAAHPAHRYMGIAVFTLASIQVLSLGLRPKQEYKYRWCWNVYHRIVGYGVIALGIVNIFFGLDMLDRGGGKVWRMGYIGFVSAVVVVAVGLEVCTRSGCCGGEDEKPEKFEAIVNRFGRECRIEII